MNQQELETDAYLERAANSQGVFIFFSALIIAILVDISAGVFGSGDIVPSIILAFSAFGLSVMQSRNFLNINSHELFLTIAYHVIWTLALFTLIEPGSLYVVAGAQLVFQTHYSFGRNGTILSVSYLILSLAMAYVANTGGTDYEAYAAVIRSAALLIMVTVTYMALLDVAREEIKRVKNVTNNLFITTQRIQLMVNSMSEAMIATDRNGRIIEYNAATLDLIDTNANLHGRFLNEVFDFHNENDETIDVLAEARAKNRILARNDLYHRYARGDSARLSITANPLILNVDGKQVSGFTFMMSDITKKMSLEEQRDEFISVVSHELRTPVAVSEGNIEIAEMAYKKNHDDPEVEEALTTAHHQIKYLSELVNDLVVLSMSEQDSAAVKIEKFSPKKLGEELVETFRESAHAKELNIRLDSQSDMRTIESSRIFVNEILNNFLTNSIKYSSRGEVLIRIEQDNFHTTFSVRDHGRGISKSDQKHIFEKFYRAEEFHTRETGGTGLGLHVAQQLAKKINAEINFESDLNVGSTFYLKVMNRQ